MNEKVIAKSWEEGEVLELLDGGMALSIPRWVSIMPNGALRLTKQIDQATILDRMDIPTKEDLLVRGNKLAKIMGSQYTVDFRHRTFNRIRHDEYWKRVHDADRKHEDYSLHLIRCRQLLDDIDSLATDKQYSIASLVCQNLLTEVAYLFSAVDRMDDSSAHNND